MDVANSEMFATPNLDITPEQEDMSLQRLFTLIDLNDLFRRTPHARIVNNETLTSQKLSKEFTDAIYSNSDGELGFVPTCQCGNIKGVTKLGLYCTLCQTECSEQFTDTLSHVSWIGLPDNLAPVLHPIWYMILKNWSSVGRRSISVVDIILNPLEEIPEDLQSFITGRGFKWFYEHHDEVLNFLLYKYPKTSKKSSAKWVEIFREVYQGEMFTRYLPILHNSLHPLKNNGGTLNYVDSTSKEILSAVIDLSAEIYKQHATSVNVRSFNKTMFDIYTRIMAYYNALISEKLGGKTALLRKHCYGSRVHFSARSVIVPHAEIIEQDHVILPWGIIVSGLKLPILNYLMNKHYKSFNEALSIFMRSLIRYDELVDQCIHRFICDSPGGYLSIAIGRNPTLRYGSIIQCKVGPEDYKKDPKDQTIAINAGIVDPMNADYDGEAVSTGC